MPTYDFDVYANSWEGDDVPGRSVWLRILGVEDSVLEDLVEEAGGSVVAHVRPKRRQRQRCGICGRRSPVYDQGDGRRRWRGLDLGYTRFFVEAAAPRVSCREHGVLVARVPWARHGSRFLRAFEDQVAWLATQCSQKACSQLMRLDWETVGRIISRVVDEAARNHDRLDDLERIGIDTVSAYSHSPPAVFRLTNSHPSVSSFERPRTGRLIRT